MESLEISQAGGRLIIFSEVMTFADDQPITDGAMSIQLIRVSDGFAFDWDSAERTFKTSGWTQDTLVVPHTADGLHTVTQSYEQAGGGATDIDMIDGEYLRIVGEFTPSGGTSVPLKQVVNLICTQEMLAAATTVNDHSIDEAPDPNQDVVLAIDGSTALSRHDLTAPGAVSIDNVEAGKLISRSGDVS